MQNKHKISFIPMDGPSINRYSLTVSQNSYCLIVLIQIFLKFE